LPPVSGLRPAAEHCRFGHVDAWMAIRTKLTVAPVLAAAP
jgi:hypothetical protein